MGFIHDQLVVAGHSVDYFCAEDIPSFFSGRLSRFAFPFFILRRAVAAHRSGKPYDLINVHEPVAGAISTLKRAAGNPVVVVTSHGVEKRGWQLALEERRLGRGGPSVKTRVVYPLTSLWQSSLGLHHADHIFCLNEEDRNYLMRWLQLGSHRFTRIYPATDTIYAAIERDYARANHLMFAGTWLKRKGTEDLISAFSILAARHPNLELQILGSGLGEETLLAAFPETLRAKVRSKQAATECENALAFAGADIYLLPSIFEGTPLTLIEAMMSGMPIITTNTCGMKDVIRDGDNGLLVPTRSPDAVVTAVERLIGDEAYRARLGRAARAEALEKYVWQRVAMPVRRVYENLCVERLK
jgi:glycosyltransferase involved in cell wall biosynthesis